MIRRLQLRPWILVNHSTSGFINCWNIWSNSEWDREIKVHKKMDRCVLNHGTNCYYTLPSTRAFSRRGFSLSGEFSPGDSRTVYLCFKKGNCSDLVLLRAFLEWMVWIGNLRTLTLTPPRRLCFCLLYICIQPARLWQNFRSAGVAIPTIPLRQNTEW